MHEKWWLAPLTALGLVLLFLGALGVKSKIEGETRTTLGNSLNTVLNSSHQALHDWAGHHLGEASIWADSKNLRHYTELLLAADRSPQSLLNNPALTDLRHLLGPVISERAYRGFFIISLDGTNLASSRDANVGVPSLLMAQHRFLSKIRSGKAAMSLPQISDVPLRNADGQQIEGLPTMFVGAPVQDSNGQVVAVLTFRIDPLDDFASLLHRGRLGLSGETFAFDSTGLLISESRFEPQLSGLGLIPHGSRSMLNLVISDPGQDLTLNAARTVLRDGDSATTMIQSALKGNTGTNLDGYRSYRGAEVLGAWLWDDELHLGLATEISLSEAYGNMQRATRYLTLLSLVAGLFLVGLATLLRISRLREEREGKRVRAAEERSRTILDAVGEGIVGVDTDGLITFLNHTATRMFGCAEDNLIGRQLQELILQADGTPVPGGQSILQGVFAGSGPRHDTGNLLQKVDGPYLPVESTTTPLQKDGKTTGAVIAFMDISAREDVERRFALALKGANAGVFDWNLETDEVFFSAEYKNMLGYDANQPDDDLRILNCIHPDEVDHAQTMLDEFLAGSLENYDVEYRLRHKDGHYLNILAKGYAFRPVGGAVTRMIGVSFDVTWRRETEEELRKAKFEAERANRAKSAFLSSMSHELRTPMNAIIGFAQLLGFDNKEPLTETQSEFVHQIRVAGDHLLGLINEILDLSKIEVGKVALSIEDVRVDEVVDGTLVLIETMANSRNITVVNDTQAHADTVIRADYSRCRQILLNILSNAVKYNRDGGTITVSSALTESAMLRLAVRDTGQGIPADKYDELFQPFSRLGAESSEIEGTGIGLTITKKLIELQGGQIGFDSEPGVGSVFWIDWPLQQGEKTAVESKKKSAQTKALFP